ncbi:hypothetical protein AA0Z99_08415 [Agrococcus sp. 1P02AA]|uniref:hypothetical protein n=1 Tax=Agrococcus sp. 1P02AA TaxID=3132259 RepID=UPI0039A6CE5B
MQKDPPRPQLYSSANIAAVLSDLQSSVTGSTSLHQWSETTDLPLDSVVAGDDLTYITLSAHDELGAPIVLMLRDGAWQRAI